MQACYTDKVIVAAAAIDCHSHNEALVLGAVVGIPDLCRRAPSTDPVSGASLEDAFDEPGQQLLPLQPVKLALGRTTTRTLT